MMTYSLLELYMSCQLQSYYFTVAARCVLAAHKTQLSPLPLRGSVGQFAYLLSRHLECGEFSEN
jgi:hypothetical protein